MKIYWLQTKGPSEEDLPETLELLKRIKKLLRISESKGSRNPISLDVKSETDRAILGQLEGTEKILKIKKLNKDVSFAPVDIEVNEKKFDAFYKEMEDREKLTASTSFDKRLCILKCGSQHYKPQRKRGRCLILKQLWAGRRIIDAKGNIKKAGQIFTIHDLAAAAGFTTSIDRCVRDAIQDIRDQIRDMKAPVEIIAQNGFMLQVKE